ncbi:hypothetical protein BD310DRAFT_927940, partial [Dichomitus squalens]
MSPHPALEVSDVLTRIFEGVASIDALYGDHNLIRKRTLASAARVCVAFHEPAMRLLWRNLDSLHPLLAPLTSYIRVGHHDTRVTNSRELELFHKIYMLDGFVDPEEWDRVVQRAKYVRSLRMTPVSTVGLVSSTWGYLLHLTGKEPLLPNLRDLTCTFLTPQSTTMALVLLSPTISSLTYYVDMGDVDYDLEGIRAWECSLRSLFSITSYIAQQLRSLRFADVGSPSPLPLSIISPLSQHRHLRTCELLFHSELNFGMLESVSSDFRSLEELSLPQSCLDSNPLELLQGCRKPARAPPAVRLGNLDTLKFPSMHGDMHCSSLAFFASPRLRRLAISIHGFEGRNELSRTSRVIAESFPSLEALRWSLYPLPLLVYTSVEVIVFVEPLLKLHEMTSLELNLSPDTFIIRNVEVQAMAKAWPRLSTLSITQPQPHPHSDLGPASLVSLATRCPRLTYLRLPVIHFPQSNLSHLTDYPLLEHPLPYIYFSKVQASGQSFGALFLYRLFPYVSSNITGPADAENKQDELRMVLEACQTSRRQRETSPCRCARTGSEGPTVAGQSTQTGEVRNGFC